MRVRLSTVNGVVTLISGLSSAAFAVWNALDPPKRWPNVAALELVGPGLAVVAIAFFVGALGLGLRRLTTLERIIRGSDVWSFVQRDGGKHPGYSSDEFLAMSSEGRERLFTAAPELKAEWARCLLGKIESEQARRDETYSAWLKSKEGQINTWANRIADDLKRNFEGFKKTHATALEDIRAALTAHLGVVERKLSIGPKNPGDTFVLRSGAGPITRKEIDAMPDAEREGLFGQNAGLRQWWEA